MVYNYISLPSWIKSDQHRQPGQGKKKENNTESRNPLQGKEIKEIKPPRQLLFIHIHR